MAKTVRKGLIYEEDLAKNAGSGSATASRSTSTGGSQTLTKLGAGDPWYFGNINNILFVDGTKYAATAAGIQAAIDALPSTGGIVWLPQGNTNIATGLTISKNVWLRGHAKGFSTQYGSQLTWTGTGGTAITISGSNVEAVLSDFSLENTGTGAVGIDIDGVTGTIVERVDIYPQATGFSTAAIRIGQTTNTVDVLLRDVLARNNAVGVQAKKVTGHLVLDHTRLKQNTTNDLQLGSGSDAVTSFRAVNGSLFEGAANTTSVTIHRAISALFSGCYAEHDGSGYFLDIPSTAVQAFNIVVDGCFVSGAAFSNATTYATNVNLSGAQLTVKNSYFTQYANPGYVIRNQAYAKVVSENNDLNSTGMTDVSGAFTNVTIKDTTVGNARVNVDRYPGQAVFQDLVQVKRLKAALGTALVAGDFALHANWGTGASVSGILGTDQGARVAILSGTTAGASPTITLTFKDGTWTDSPAIAYGRGDVAAVAAGTGDWRLTNVTATVATWTFNGTPNDSTTYILDFTVMGR